MFPGKSVPIRMEIVQRRIGDFIDWFGRTYTVLKRSKDGRGMAEISVRANETAVFYWAMQYSGIANILSPPSLRKQLKEAFIAGAEKYADA